MRKSAEIARTALILSVSCRGIAADPLFSTTVLSEELRQPVAMAFGPGGDLFVAEKNGAIRLLHEGALVAEPLYSMEVHTDSECGLLGLALHPEFAANGYMYLFATVTPQEQQIIRITARNGRGEDPVVIRGLLPTVGLNHNGGCLRIGLDGKLYFSVGDNQDGDNAQRVSTLAGKLCRINLDGSTPEDNPFRTSTGFPRAIWASGFRNPFRFDIAPDGRLFVLDVGSDSPSRREEINIVRAGDNGGWPRVEGDFEQRDWPDYLRPAFSYTQQGSAPAGACYYTGQQFPPEYQGNFFHADYVSNWIYRLQLDGDRVISHSEFIRVDGGPVDLLQGPDGSIYYCCLISGAVGRIDYMGPAFEPVPPQNAAPPDVNEPSAQPSNSGSPVQGASTDGEPGAASPMCAVSTPIALSFALVGNQCVRRRRSEKI